MDSSPFDYSLFDQAALTDETVSDGQPPSLPGTGDSGNTVTGTTSSNGNGGGLHDDTSIVDVITGDLLANIPGISYAMKALKLVQGVLPDIENAISTAERWHPLNTINAAAKFAGHADKLLQLSSNDFWGWLESVTIDQLFESMLHDGLGIDVGAFNEEELKAVKTVDTMLGFAALVQFVGEGINSVGKAMLGERWSESVGTIIGKLPEEMGLSWALGLTIDESFKAAQGVILEEAINKQKHPNRIAWQQLRVMLKQHVIEEDAFRELANAQGFPKEQIDMLVKLQDVLLPVGDIQQLWYRDIIDNSEAIRRIRALGFTDDDATMLFGLYMAKAENEASVTYRSIARQMYTAHLLSGDQYRDILDKANFPKKLIDDDIAAITLEQDVGKVLTSVTVIKQEYQHNTINDKEATQKLAELNYAPEYIAELLKVWNLPPLRRSHGLSQAKILSYYMAGLIKPDDARTQLLALNLTPDSVDFLLQHPTANSGVKTHARSPGLVTQAYVDGIIHDEQLQDAYKSAGVADSDMHYYVGVAQYRFQHRKGHAHGTLTLNASEVRAAFKTGLFDFEQCVARLKDLGYTDDAAMLLTEITNKGPEQPNVPPIFATVNAAIAWMQSNGYTVYPPPDPTLMAAEQTLAAQGYSWTGPASSGVPGGRGDGGGVPPVRPGGGDSQPPVVPIPIIINPPSKEPGSGTGE